MKKIIIMLALALAAFLPAHRATAQAQEIAQLVLNIEKLAQFKQILSDMKKYYQILQGGYNTVKNISKGDFKLHKSFLDGLSDVSPAVRNYRRVADIGACQMRLLSEYKKAYNRFKQDKNFNAGELDYIVQVYDRLVRESLRNLDELLLVVTSGKTRMTDDERIRSIDRIYGDMQDKLLFLRHFNTGTTLLAVQRAKERNDIQTLQSIYGINN